MEKLNFVELCNLIFASLLLFDLILSFSLPSCVLPGAVSYLKDYFFRQCYSCYVFLLCPTFWFALLSSELFNISREISLASQVSFFAHSAQSAWVVNSSCPERKSIMITVNMERNKVEMA